MSIRDVLKSRGGGGAYSEVVDRVYAVWRRRLLATALGIAVPLLPLETNPGTTPHDHTQTPPTHIAQHTPQFSFLF